MFRTLLVEDNRPFRESLKETLGLQVPSMEIIEAGDGREALEKVDDLCPDLIFMDIQLPGENGLTLTKRIKTNRPKTIIVILTSHDLPEYREAASRHGADHFISKGLSTREEILAVVESVLSDKES